MRNADGSASELIFFHIPKTAGTTFHSIIKKNYQPDDIARCYGHSASTAAAADISQALVQETRAGLHRGAAVVMGHFDWSAVEETAGRHYRTFTFFRNPLDRLISNYLHIQRSDAPDHRELIQQLPGFDSWITQARFQNTYCQFLSDLPTPTDLTEADMRTLYECARRNLSERLDLIGITEQFDDSIVALRAVLGWKNTRYRASNSNPEPEMAMQLRRDFSDTFMAHNKYDFELYREALELFEKQKREVPLFGLRKFYLSNARQLQRQLA